MNKKGVVNMSKIIKVTEQKVSIGLEGGGIKEVGLDNLNFLPEQIEREGHKSAWVMQLSWSHAMYVIVKDKLMKK